MRIECSRLIALLTVATDIITASSACRLQHQGKPDNSRELGERRGPAGKSGAGIRAAGLGAGLTLQGCNSVQFVRWSGGVAAGKLQHAVDILMSSFESATSKVSLQSPLLNKMRTLVHGTGMHMDEQDQRIRVLGGQVQSQRRYIRTLQQESDRARQERDKGLQAVLLGQAAYTLSGLVEAHVYQGQPTGEL